jgi:hypothetical protein
VNLPRTSACAITNKTVDGVDPYSETAMEELEKLGFDEEEEDITEDKNGASVAFSKVLGGV